jgi:hypothetical protein
MAAATTVRMGSVTQVSSIASLKTAAADNNIDEIVLADGTYSIVNATSELTTSLFFGSSLASRTRPLTIRAATTGGVTFDGASASMCGLFTGVGAHDLTFDGFRFANVNPVSTGVVTVSRHISGADEAAPYNLSFKNITVLATCLGANSPGNFTDHAFYISSAALPGPYGLLFEDCTVVPPADTTRLLHSVLHMFGDENATDTTPTNVTARRVSGTAKDGALIWGTNIADVLLDTCTFTDCTVFGVRQRYANTNIEYRATHSTGSGTQGYFCDVAVPDNTPPSGTTFTSGSSFS